MLEFLSVKNIALIENAEIYFNNGLNVLTGETGAGKSILLDSIGLLLGNRIDKSLVRTGEDSCKVVGKFSLDNHSGALFKEFCDKYDLEFQDEILITRSYKTEGKSEIRINGEQVTLAMLKELCSFLVDSYGQNENQIVFDTNNHLTILDGFAKTNELDEYNEYTKNFARLKEIEKKLRTFGGNDFERLKTIDILRYQVDEIENANISQTELDDLENKRHLMMNLGKVVSNTVLAQNFLDESCIQNISKAKSSIDQASMYDETLKSYVDRLESVKIELYDILESVKEYNNEVDFSEEEQQKIEDRLSLYNKLLRKYGKTVDEVLNNKEKMNSELLILENADKEIAELEKEKRDVEQKLHKLGKLIRDYRKENAEKLCKSILNNLQNLGMKNAKLSFCFEPDDENIQQLYFNGIDKVELLFSANLGEEPKPLSKIASGGEISRFMLALKSVIASSDNMPTMIFDEIDTGISGVTSEAVAKQMAIIGKNHQVIVVTHAHQIASMANVNFLIKKEEGNGRTITTVKKLNEIEKVEEIARFLSGDKLTEISIKNAKDLIDEQNQYKKSI